MLHILCYQQISLYGTYFSAWLSTTYRRASPPGYEVMSSHRCQYRFARSGIFWQFALSSFRNQALLTISGCCINCRPAKWCSDGNPRCAVLFQQLSGEGKVTAWLQRRTRGRVWAERARKVTVMREMRNLKEKTCVSGIWCLDFYSTNDLEKQNQNNNNYYNNNNNNYYYYYYYCCCYCVSTERIGNKEISKAWTKWRRWDAA